MANDEDPNIQAGDPLQALLETGANASAEKKPASKKGIDGDSLELTEKDKEELEAQAAKDVAKEIKATKRQEFLEAAKQRLKKLALFRDGKDDTGEDLESVLITLAPHSPFISLDGKRYYANRMYRLNKGTAGVVKDQMYRGALHDAETHGKNMSEFYGQRPRGTVLTPSTPI